MYFSARPVLLSSAFLLAALPAAASDEAVAPAAAPAPRATTNCPGISSVPMTADAAQALPLHLLRNLSCGESVVMLSDSEGYTVHVRSADGTAGYVARYVPQHGRRSERARPPAALRHRREQRRPLASRRAGLRPVLQQGSHCGVSHCQRRHRPGLPRRFRLEIARHCCRFQ